MATTSIWPVKHHLGRVVDYAGNPEKTDATGGMNVVVEYATQAKKTESQLYVTGLNCDPATASEEMMLTKQAWRRLEPGRAIAYHGYQSFLPGEATPQQAHAVGVEFARKMWGDRFQVVVATHLDRSHLHNHFVLNSISFVDGLRYHDNKASYYGGIRVLSDQICREYGLSVIDHPKGQGKHYAEWKAEQAGKPTLRTLLKADIDDIVRSAYTFPTFLEELRRRGYKVDANPNHAHIVVIPPGTDVHIRLSAKLGEAYSEQGIKERLARQRAGLPDEQELPRSAPQRYRQTGRRPGQRRKLKGFVALYYHYLFFLKIIKAGKAPKRLPFSVRKEVIKLEKYNRQFLYLYRHNITTTEELQAHRQGIQAQIDTLTQRRKPLYAERRNAAGESAASVLSEQISGITASLRQLRKARAVCDAVAVDAPEVAEKIRQAEQVEAQREQEKKKPDKFRLL